MLATGFTFTPLKPTCLAPSGEEPARWQFCANQRLGVYPENSSIWGHLGDIAGSPAPPTSLQFPPGCKLAEGKIHHKLKDVHDKVNFFFPAHDLLFLNKNLVGIWQSVSLQPR